MLSAELLCRGPICSLESLRVHISNTSERGGESETDTERIITAALRAANHKVAVHHLFCHNKSKLVLMPLIMLINMLHLM